MKRALILAMMMLAGCVTSPVSEYQRLAAIPTPDTWKIGEPWVVIVLDKKGRIFRSMTIRFTDREARTCTSGNWKELEILAQQPPAHPQFLGMPAYELEGSAMLIDLNSNLCDASMMLRGRVSDAGISGTYGTETPWGGEILGQFHAVRSMPNKPLHPTALRNAARER